MLSKKYRLTEDFDFKRVLKFGRVFRTPFFTLVVKENQKDFPRFGFFAGKKVGKAVKRNRVKRILRETVKKKLSRIRGGVDVVVIGRKKAQEADSKELVDSIDQGFRKLGLYKENLKT